MKNPINKMKENDEYRGFGYIGHEIRDYIKADKLVLKAIKELKYNDEEAFLFLNSRDGRWLGDSLMMWLDNKKYKNKEIVQWIVETIKRAMIGLRKEVSDL